MDVDRESIDVLHYQREQLQVNVLNPLQKIKENIGRRLQRKEVQIIKSFLRKDILKETLDKARDGEALVTVLDLYYGKDNLKFIERLLYKASCQDLVEMLQDWKSNNKMMVPNIFYKFGFFPVWIKVNYNFNEFSKHRQEVFNTLKKVFAIPSTNYDDRASDYTVFMGVSLGKRDVLMCVLVPHCVRKNIRASLRYEDITLTLRNAHITGIYFARIKGQSSLSLSRAKDLAGSDSSISSVMTSDFGELCDPAYEDINPYSTGCNDSYDSSSTEVYLPRSFVQTDHNLNIIIDKKIDLNGNCKDPEDSVSYIKDNKAQSGDSPRRQGNQSERSVNPYLEDTNKNTDPKLVRASYGYVEPSPIRESTSKVPNDGDNLSYGACFFVGYNSAPKKVFSQPTKSSVPSAREDRSSSSLTKDCYRPDGYTRDLGKIKHLSRDSPRSDQEEMLFSQRTELSFEEQLKFDSDHEKELTAWSNEINQNTKENDEDPSLWYQPKPTTEFTYERQQQEQLGNAQGRSPVHSEGEQRDGEGKSTTRLSSETDLRPRYWWEDEHSSGYHRDSFDHPRNEQSPSNRNDFQLPEMSVDSQRLSYHGDRYGYHRHNEYPSNYECDQEYSNRQGNQGHSYHGNGFGYYRKEPFASNHSDKERHPYYHGNDLSYLEGDQVQRFMEPEPEPEPSSSITSRLSSEQRNGRASSVVSPRQSTPSSSSSSFFQAGQSVNLRSTKISRSMPTLYAKQDVDMLNTPPHRWSDSRHSNCYHGNYPKYESQTDLEDSVFVDTHNNSVKFKASPPPYHPPPDYHETMIRKSYLSLSSVSLDSKRMKVKSPLLSSHSVSCIYREKEMLLSREELQKTIRSAEEKQYEILLEKSKEFLTAAKLGDEEEVKNLLEEDDVDVDYKNEFGHTALMVASREGHLDVVQVLIDHGADMNIQDKYGKSALHEAAWSGQHQVIHPLILNEADMNCVDEEGRTPLHYASLRGKTKVVEVLLLNGADISILNKNGDSAVEVAYRCRHKDIVKMLLRATDEKTRKDMKGKIRKQKIQRIRTATSLPNLTKATSLKTLKRSRSKPDMNKKGACVTQ